MLQTAQATDLGENYVEKVRPARKQIKRPHRVMSLAADASFSGIRAVAGLNEKACRGRSCGRLSVITEQQLGGGVLLFPQTPLGGGVGRLPIEPTREEVHRFDKDNIHALPAY
jgi:hypothetical protein